MLDARRRTLALLAGIAVAIWFAAQLRLAQVLLVPNLEGSDPATRALFGRQLGTWGWPALYEQTVWPPLHFWFLAWADRVLPSPALAARLPGLVAGTLLVWPAALIARRSAGPGWGLLAGVLAAALVAINPLSVRYSALSFAEPLAAPFALAGIAALLPRGGRPARWWLAVPAFAAAAALRNECIALLPLLWLVPAPRRTRVIVGLAAAAPGAVWLLARPVFLAFNTVARQDLGEAVPRLLPERLAAITDLAGWTAEATWPAVLVIGLLGIRRARPVALGLAALAAFWIAASLAGHVPAFERYTLLPTLLLCVLAGVGATELAQRLPRPRLAAALLALVLLGTASTTLRRSLEQPQEQPLDLLATAGSLASIPGNLPVFIDPAERTASYIALEAGLRVDRVARLYRDPRNDRVLLRDLDLMRRGLGPLLLVTVEDGEFERGLPLEPRCAPQRLGRSQATCLAEHGPYRVWRIQP